MYPPSSQAKHARLTVLLTALLLSPMIQAQEVWRLEPDKTGTVVYERQVSRDRFGCGFVQWTRHFGREANRSGLAPLPVLPAGLHIGTDNDYRVRSAFNDRCYRFRGRVSVGLLHFDVDAFKILGAPGPNHRIVLRADVFPDTQIFFNDTNRRIGGGAEFSGNRCAFFSFGLPEADWAAGETRLRVLTDGSVADPMPMRPTIDIVASPLNSTFTRFDIDVTNLIIDWNRGVRPNHGFAILPWEARDGQAVQMVRDGSYCMASGYNWRLALEPR